ncbi:MAG TPA: beta-ketoacyl synthase N-terminal-like domain-containing protein [Candidatus Eisenbacteria bacterium]
MSEAIVVTGLGAVSPVGLSAPATCAALRAGIARLGAIETHRVEGPQMEPRPVTGGRVPTEWLAGEPEEEAWPGHERFGAMPPPPATHLVAPGAARLIELARVAAREAWEQAGLAVAPVRVTLYLGVDERDDAQAVGRELGPLAASLVVERTGRAAALTALDRAARDLAAKRIECALVGGVDSLVRREILEGLDREGRLRQAGRPGGVTPGEGAAFLVVEREPTARGRGVAPIVRVLGTAVADEPTAGTDEPNRGEGLTRALRAAREAAGPLDAKPLVVCDLDGDRYRALEWSFADLRALGDLPGGGEVWHHADCIGDAGAAHNALGLVWAATALERGYARRAAALVWGASAGKTRAATVLGAMREAEG